MAAADNSQSDQSSSYHILLVGMTGQGKSATGNTILGRKQFVSLGGLESVTREHHVGYANLNGRTLKVVDIPGYADTGCTEQAAGRMLVAKAMTDALVKFPNGFDVVLLVISYTSKLTQAEKSGINALVSLCDKEAFKSHGIVIITNGDGFRREHTDFEKWRKKQTAMVQWIFKTCENRCILFDNVTTEAKIIKNQKEQLISMIERIKANNHTDTHSDINTRYIPEICRVGPGKLPQFSRARLTVTKLETAYGYLAVADDNVTNLIKTQCYDNNALCDFKRIVDSALTQAMTFKEVSFLEAEFQLCFGELNAMNLTNIVMMGNKMHVRLQGMMTQIDIKTSSTFYWEYLYEKIKSVGDAVCSIL